MRSVHHTGKELENNTVYDGGHKFSTINICLRIQFENQQH